MSKNLRGYSSAMQNVNLRDIVADSVTATNGTFTTLNMATFNITQQLAVNNLINSGVLRLTGITNNTSTEDMKILVRSTTDNNVYELTNFTMNASTGLLSAGALKLTSLLTLPSGTASSNSRLLFRHWSGNVYMSEGVEWNEVTDTLTVAKLKITSITTPVASANHPILIIDNDEIKKAPVLDIFYNSANQSLTAHHIVASNEIYYKSQTLDARFANVSTTMTTNTAQTVSGVKTFQNKQEFDEIKTTGDIDCGAEIYYKSQTLDARFQPIGSGGATNTMTTDTAQTVSGVKTFQNKQEFDEIETTGDVEIGGGLTFNNSMTMEDGSNNKIFKMSFSGTTPVIMQKHFSHKDTYQVGMWSNHTRIYGEDSVYIEVDDSTGIKSPLFIVDKSSITCNTDLHVTGSSAILKNNDDILSETENDAKYVRLTTSQTITGDKTFNGLINASQIQVTSTNESSISNDQPILFLDSNSKIRTNSSLTIKPSTGQLKSNSLLCSGNVAGANVTLSNLISPSSGSDIDYPILFRGVSNVIMKGAIEYNHSTETLKVPKIESDLSTTNITCKSEGRIDFDSGAIFDHHPGDVYLGMVGSKVDIGYQIAFWNTGETRHRANTRYRWYIQDNATTSTFYERMKLNNNGLNIYGDISIFDFTDNTRLLQIINDSTASNHGVFYSHPTSHIFRKGTSWKFKISDNKINAYEELEIGSSSSSKNLVVNGDTSTTTITMTTPDEIATGTARDVNIMIHDGNTGGDNKLKILGGNKLTYNGSGAGTLSIPTLKLTGMGTDGSSNDRSLMFLNGSNKIVKSLDDLTFNNFTKTFKVSNIETDDIKSVLSTVASGGSSDDMPLLFQNPSSLSIKKVDLVNANGSYNASTDTFKMKNLEISHQLLYDGFPLNYTEKIVCTDALNKVSTYLSSSPNASTNLGTWGNVADTDPYYLSVQYNDPTFIKSIIAPSSFSRTYSAWFWETAETAISLNQTIINTSFFGRYFALFNGNDSGYTWRMRLRVRMKNNSTNRISPVIRLVTEELNGSTTTHIDSEFTHYIRSGLAKFSTIECLYIIPNATTHQKYRLDLRCSRAGNVAFQSVLTNNDYKIETFVQTFECLGKSEESSILNPYAQTL